MRGCTTTVVVAFVAAGLLSILMTCRAGAASVTWGPAQTISADTDVSTAGTSVAAFNVGTSGTAATTVNGVTFQPFIVSAVPTSVGNFTLASGTSFSGTNSLAGSGNAPFNNLSAAYQALLAAAVEPLSIPATYTLTMSSLTVGTQYQFQWWTDLSNGGNTTTTTASAGNSVTLSQNTTAATGGVGQFAIGTFTADAATEVITFAVNSGGNALGQFNAFQLRALPAVGGGGSAPLPAARWPGLGSLAAIAVAAGALRRRVAGT
jgi:hypothetical protein